MPSVADTMRDIESLLGLPSHVEDEELFDVTTSTAGTFEQPQGLGWETEREAALRDKTMREIEKYVDRPNAPEYNRIRSEDDRTQLVDYYPTLPEDDQKVLSEKLHELLKDERNRPVPKRLDPSSSTMWANRRDKQWSDEAEYWLPERVWGQLDQKFKTQLDVHRSIEDPAVDPDLKIEAAMDHFRRRYRDDEWTAGERAGYFAEALPGAGLVKEAFDFKQAYESGQKIAQDAERKPEDRQAAYRDYMILGRYLTDIEQEAEKGNLRKAGDMAIQMPAFIIEFMVSTPAFAGGKALFRKGAKKVLGEGAERLMKRRLKDQTRLKDKAAALALKSAESLTGVAGQTAAMPQLIVNNYMQRIMPDVDPGDPGKKIIQDILENPNDGFENAFKNVWGATADSVIEVLSERSGGTIAKATGLAKLKGWLSERLIGKGYKPGVIRDVLRRGGWDGYIEEILEEHFGDILRIAVPGVEGGGVISQALQGNYAQAMHDQLVQAVAFAALPGAQMAAETGPAALRQRRRRLRFDDIREQRTRRDEAVKRGFYTTQSASEIAEAATEGHGPAQRAMQIADIDKPSRSQWNEAGLGQIGSDETLRADFSRMLREARDREVAPGEAAAFTAEEDAIEDAILRGEEPPAPEAPPVETAEEAPVVEAPVAELPDEIPDDLRFHTETYEGGREGDLFNELPHDPETLAGNFNKAFLGSIAREMGLEVKSRDTKKVLAEKIAQAEREAAQATLESQAELPAEEVPQAVAEAVAEPAVEPAEPVAEPTQPRQPSLRLQETVRKQFPKGKITGVLSDGSVRVDLGGSQVIVKEREQIDLPPDEDLPGYGQLSDETKQNLQRYGPRGLYQLFDQDGNDVDVFGVIQLREGLTEQEFPEVLRHEAIHFYRSMGHFTDQEWDLLVSEFSDPSKSIAEQEEEVARGVEFSGRHRSLWERIKKAIDRFLRALGLSRNEVGKLLDFINTPEFQSRMRVPERTEAWKEKFKGGAASIAKKPSQPYKFRPFDVSKPGDRDFYHGTNSLLESLPEADPTQFSNAANLFGEGLYLTDSYQIGEGYSQLGRRGVTAGGAKVLGGRLKDNVKLIDLSKPLPSNVLRAWGEMTYGREYFTEKEFERLSKLPGERAFKEMQEAMADEFTDEGDVITTYQEMVDAGQELGYDGLHHIGGRRTVAGKKHGPHNVVVLWGTYDKPLTETIETLPPERTAPPPPAIFGDKALTPIEVLSLLSVELRDHPVGTREDDFGLSPGEVYKAAENIGLNREDLARLGIIQYLKDIYGNARKVDILDIVQRFVQTKRTPQLSEIQEIRAGNEPPSGYSMYSLPGDRHKALGEPLKEVQEDLNKNMPEKVDAKEARKLLDDAGISKPERDDSGITDLLKSPMKKSKQDILERVDTILSLDDQEGFAMYSLIPYTDPHSGKQVGRKPFLEAARFWMRRWMLQHRGMGMDFWNLYTQSRGRIDEIFTSARQNMIDFDDAVHQWTAGENIRFHDSPKMLLLDQAQKGDKDAMAKLPAYVQNAVQANRDHIDALSKELIDAGVADGPLELSMVQTLVKDYDGTLKERWDKFRADNPHIQSALEAIAVASHPRTSGETHKPLVKGKKESDAAYNKRNEASKKRKDDKYDKRIAGIVDDMYKGEALRFAILNNLGRYATRKYNVFRAPAEWKEFLSQNTKLIADLRAELAEAHEEWSEDQIDRYITDLLHVEEEIRQGTGGRIIGQKVLDQFKKRKNLDESLRRALGEVQDPRQNYFETVHGIANLLGNHQFLSQVAKLGLESGMLMKEEDAPGHYIRLDPNSPKWNESLRPLAGLRMEPELAAAFYKFYSPLNQNWIFKTYRSYLLTMKTWKTVYSPPTQARNFGANMWFEVANGTMSPFFGWGTGRFARGMGKAARASAEEFGPDIPRVIRKLAGKVYSRDPAAKEEARRMMRRYARLELIREGINIAELEDISRDSLQLTQEKFYEKWASKMKADPGAKALQKAIRGGMAAHRVAATAYHLGDAFWKIYAFETERERRVNAYQQDGVVFTEEDLDWEVAHIVRNTRPTYANVSELMKALRRSPLVGTFVSFPAESIRVTYHTAALAFKEINSPYKGIKSIGIQRLIGMGLAHSPWQALATATAMWFGMGPDDEEDIRENFGPHWIKNSKLMHLGQSEDGKKRYYIDTQYSNPHYAIHAPIVALWRGEDPADSVLRAGWEFFEPFLGEEMSTSDFIDLYMNQARDRGGAKIWYEDDDFGNQVMDMAGYLWDRRQPGFVSTARRIMDPHLSTKRELLGAVGIRVSTIDIPMSFQINAGKEKRRISGAQTRLTNVIQRRDSSHSDIVNTYVFSERTRKDAWKRTREMSWAAFRQKGLSFDDIYQRLKGYHGEHKGSLIWQGKYKPYIPGEDATLVAEGATNYDFDNKEINAMMSHLPEEERAMRRQALQEGLRRAQTDEPYRLVEFMSRD